MTSKLTILFAALLITGCGGNSNHNSAPASTTSAAPASSAGITSQKIESCWKQAGLQGDIYRFLTPQEVLGLQSIGGATDQQVSQFKSCATS
jgi:hypothetical protein